MIVIKASDKIISNNLVGITVAISIIGSIFLLIINKNHKSPLNKIDYLNDPEYQIVNDWLIEKTKYKHNLGSLASDEFEKKCRKHNCYNAFEVIQYYPIAFVEFSNLVFQREKINMHISNMSSNFYDEMEQEDPLNDNKLKINNMIIKWKMYVFHPVIKNYKKSFNLLRQIKFDPEYEKMQIKHLNQINKNNIEINKQKQDYLNELFYKSN